MLLIVAATGTVSAGPAGARVAIPVALAAAVLPLAAWAAQERLVALDRSALGPWIGHAADATGVVLQPPRSRSYGRTVALVEVRAGPGSGERVLVAAKGTIRARVGEEVRVRGGWRALPEFERSMRRAGAHALLVADSVTPTGRRRGGALGAVDGVRRRAERALTQGLSPPLAALARGMVLGQDDGLSEKMTEDFRGSGLAHLVAASGANVALLAAFVLALGAATGIPRTPRLVAAVVLVAAYVPLAGGGPSIQRAGIMGAATLVAVLASQPASRWYALLLAAGATLGLNPRAAEDAGWQLSFAAVLAILALVAPLRAALERRLPRVAAEALAVCLVASAATAPLIALHFGRLSWVTIPANMLAVPAVAPVMWLGTAAAALGQLTPVLAVPATALAAWPLAFVAWVAEAAAGLPGADAEADIGAPLAAVWAAVLVAVAVPRARARLAKLTRPGRTALARRRLLAPAFAAALASAAVLAGPSSPAAPPPGLSVSALDVGQGDATLIRHGPHAVLVDAGPPDGPILERLDELGVRRLDVLVVTHAQADHDGGAAAVLSELGVGMVLDGRDGISTPDGDRFAAVAAAGHVRMVPAAAGQRIRAGPIRLDILGPRPEPARDHAGEDPNQRAVVAEVRDGAFSMLMPADAESDVLRALPLGPVDVLKVSHHGSADPGLPEVLDRLRPKVALIEVGEHNTYGHPAPDTLLALESVPRLYRTDRDGTVTIQPPT
ncbi:MAG: ComEC/Rec2 family competence protein [Solirubrobacteraceae bacterium]